MSRSNRLALESSPYLQQHAQNPVDWYPWGEEALSAAQSQNKPILVSIGYAACHWCHVMERESFEDEAVAALMNEGFINIKIDREERPDLDHIYMDAVQTMTGSGGWPLNVFLTPDRKPFYGGTYFPPSPAFNRPSWRDILRGVSDAWRDRREEIGTQAENLTQHLSKSNDFGLHKTGSHVNSDKSESVGLITKELLKSADVLFGGFGNAPKFPQTNSIAFLLRYYYFYKDENALQQALLSLDKMISGGIYDQLGGGLARYSTDAEWLVPHFEKMLYDQAQFIGVLCDAYQLTGNVEYIRVIDQTMEFLKREMMSPEFGFYAALDADSEGEEGKFYVWELGEIKKILGDDTPLAMAWYGITEEGNWEGINILTHNLSIEELSLKFNIDSETAFEKIGIIEKKLLALRGSRVRPGLDDKQLVGWNALMNMTCSKAFSATGKEDYRQLAIRNMEWMDRVFIGPDMELFHTYKDGIAKFPGFLDDYAYLVQALIYLQEISGKQEYLEKANKLTEQVLRIFNEEGNHLFYYTGINQQDVVFRKREIYDSAQPSGNSVMVFNLQYLGQVLDKQEWRQRALDMLESMGNLITKYPGSFGFWAIEWMRATWECAEIVVVGPQVDVLRTKILANFIPFRIFQSSTYENQAYPLLRNKPSASESLIYVCQNYSCRQPVTSVAEMLSLLWAKPQ
jgi:uncharacterized protein YyaL (SSP411 family)